MTADDRRRPGRDQRRIEVTGAFVDGGVGGIRVGGDMTVTSTVSQAADGLTERDRQLAEAVVDAFDRLGLAVSAELAAAVDGLAAALAAEPARRSRVRAALEQVALHAGTAGAVFAAAQLALDTLT